MAVWISASRQERKAATTPLKTDAPQISPASRPNGSSATAPAARLPAGFIPTLRRSATRYRAFTTIRIRNTIDNAAARDIHAHSACVATCPHFIGGAAHPFRAANGCACRLRMKSAMSFSQMVTPAIALHVA